MPITYSFDQERKLIVTKVLGELTIALTEDYFARLDQDTNCPEDAIEIVDFSGATDFKLQYGDMSWITQRYQRTKSTRDVRATFFNCTFDLSYGIARMLQALHQIANEEHTVIITRSQEELDKSIEELRYCQANAAGAS